MTCTNLLKLVHRGTAFFGLWAIIGMVGPLLEGGLVVRLISADTLLLAQYKRCTPVPHPADSAVYPAQTCAAQQLWARHWALCQLLLVLVLLLVAGLSLLLPVLGYVLLPWTG
jgi:hypothetical protein